MIIISFVISVAVFDFPYISADDMLHYPIGDDVRHMSEEMLIVDDNLENLGISGDNLSSVLGSLFIILLLTILGLVLIIFGFAVRRLNSCFFKVH